MAPAKRQYEPCRCGSPTCEIDKNIKKTSDLLGTSMNGAALILNTLTSLSSGGPPGLSAASGTVLMIVQIFQNMSDVQSGFGILIHDICNVMIGVAHFTEERGGKVSKQMKRALDELNYRLGAFKEYGEKMKTRSKLQRFIFATGDKAKVLEYRGHFTTALNLFQLEMGLDTNYNTYNNKPMSWKVFQTFFDQALAIAGAETDLHAHTAQEPAASSAAPAPQITRPVNHVPLKGVHHQPKDSPYASEQYDQEVGHQQYSQSNHRRHDEPHPQQNYPGNQNAYPAQGYYGGQGWPPQHQPSPQPINNVGSAQNVNFGANFGNFIQN